MSALLDVRGVTKRFGSLAALKDVDVRVEEGQIVGLIGPNGAGKTTLVNVITGSARGWTGEVRFRDRSLRRLRPHRVGRLGVARTFQIAHPFADMTVVENVMVGALYGRAHRLRARAAHDRALELLEPLGLAGKATRPAQSLTAPERKRLEIAKALATEPQLLLLDEVMAGLTPAEIDVTVELIRTVHARGVTILIIEHVMRAIASLADRVVVLHHGEKLFEGTPEETFSEETVIGAYLGGARH